MCLDNRHTLLSRAQTKHISLIGRANVIKINVLPKCMYLFQLIPLKYPSKMFIELNGIISRFMWAEKKIRVKISTLQAPTSKGALNLPHLKIYYLASQLRSVWSWLEIGNTHPAWVTIEQQLVKPMPLSSIPFIGSLRNLHKITKSQIICHTFECWQQSFWPQIARTMSCSI